MLKTVGRASDVCDFTFYSGLHSINVGYFWQLSKPTRRSRVPRGEMPRKGRLDL